MGDIDPSSVRRIVGRHFHLPLQVSLRRTGRLEQRIKEICQTRVRYGYRRVHVLLRREGWPINQKKTRRVYRELGLQLRNKTPKRRVKAKLREDRRNATRPNETWAMDFVHDQLATGRKLRVLPILSIATQQRRVANAGSEASRMNPVSCEQQPSDRVGTPHP